MQDSVLKFSRSGGTKNFSWTKGENSNSTSFTETLNSSGRRQVIPILPESRQILDAQITPDGRLILYIADQNIEGVFELFSVPVCGGKPKRLNPELSTGGNVTQFQISPDGRQVVYLSDQNVDNMFELFIVSIDGGTAVKLNPSLCEGGSVISDFQINASGTQVVYRADQNSRNVFELFSTPTKGGPAVQLNHPLADREIILDFTVSSTNDQVLYRALPINGRQSLYSVAITGDVSEQINPDLSSGEAVSCLYEINADGDLAVYAIRDAFGIKKIFVSPIGGGFHFQVTPLRSGALDIYDFKISPNSDYIVYQAAQKVGGEFELFSVPIFGDGFEVLSGQSAGANNVRRLSPSSSKNSGVSAFQISPDSDHVVYSVAQKNSNFSELFSVPISGVDGVKAKPNMICEDNITFFEISPKDNQIVYESASAVNGVLQLFWVKNGGIAAISARAQTVDHSDNTFSYEISHNGEFTVYITPDSRQLIAAHR